MASKRFCGGVELKEEIEYKTFCDKCGKEINTNWENGELHWLHSKELRNEPEDMDDEEDLDTREHFCIKCKPLPEYTKVEENKE